MNSILIAGPTASGKSGLALALAKKYNGVIINADALQVYDQWRILTARPSREDETMAPHALYGHVMMDQHYSVGAWIKDVRNILQTSDLMPIFVGGTGLYFSALTNGLADIPAIPPEIRARGNEIRDTVGRIWFHDKLAKDDPETFGSIDQQNPARLQRAWEVLETTGKGLAFWKSTTPPPMIKLEETTAIVLNWNVNSLNNRINTRFKQMMEMGALNEVEAVEKAHWHPALPSSRALGASELIDIIHAKTTIEDAVNKAQLLTRQFAKRQRTWFRSKMSNWRQIPMDDQMSAKEIIATLDS